MFPLEICWSSLCVLQRKRGGGGSVYFLGLLLVQWLYPEVLEQIIVTGRGGYCLAKRFFFFPFFSPPPPPPLLVTFQSFRQTEWIPAGELHVESGLHPWRDGRPAQPLAAAPGAPWVCAEGLIEAGVSRIRGQAETMWLASTPTGSHPICWSHYRKRRCHHSEHYQTDSV